MNKEYSWKWRDGLLISRFEYIYQLKISPTITKYYILKPISK